MKLSLKLVLTSGIILLIITTAAVIGSFSYLNTRSSIEDMIDKIMEITTQRTIEQAITYVQPAEDAAFLMEKLASSRVVQTKEYSKMLQLFKDQLFIYKQFSSIYYGDNKGNFYQAKRNESGNIDLRIIKSKKSKDKKGKIVESNVQEWHKIQIDGSIKVGYKKNVTYDPRKRPWYQTARSKGKGIHWTDVYVFSSDKNLGITIMAPVAGNSSIDPDEEIEIANDTQLHKILKGNNEIAGVIGVDIKIAKISEFLKDLELSKSGKGKAFIINHKGKIVSYPQPKIITKMVKSDKGYEHDLKHIREISTHPSDLLKDKNNKISPNKKELEDLKEHQHTVESFFQLENEMQKTLKTTDLAQLSKMSFKFVHNDITYRAMYSAYPSGFPKNWIIGIFVPEDDFLYTVKENTKMTGVIAGVSVIVSILGALYLASKITSPLKKLETETKRIQKFELESEDHIESGFTEIQNMSSSFANMKKGLKSFEKFVPSEVVRYLVESGQEAKIEGKKKELTIYFSDIASFTSISEAFVPEALVEYLGEYLSSMSEIIVEHEGTLDKYIGDAIMAFWGAPKGVEDQAVKACYASLENRDKLAQLREVWRGFGKPPFEARIGLNTGECIVGNMGSIQRLNYTVIGDAVNLASRLEGINKVYGTEICMSESTYNQAKNYVEARVLDLVAVKGKSEPVKVYELIAKKNDIDANQEKFINLCTEGFVNYTEKNFREAIAIYTEAMSLYPDDKLVKIYINRCNEYLTHPPEENWDGVFIMKTK